MQRGSAINSTAWLMNCGSRDSLNCRRRCGCSPCARQIRCTELTLMPTASAIAAAVQWVVSPGGSANVRATVCAHRRRQRWDARRSGLVAQQPIDAFGLVTLRPALDRVRALAALAHDGRRSQPRGRQQHDPRRQTCFCGLLRSATTASKRSRSPASSVIPWRIPGPPINPKIHPIR